MSFEARDLMVDVFPARGAEVGGGWCEPITGPPCGPASVAGDSGDGQPELVALPVLHEQLRQALQA